MKGTNVETHNTLSDQKMDGYSYRGDRVRDRAYTSRAERPTQTGTRRPELRYPKPSGGDGTGDAAVPLQ